MKTVNLVTAILFICGNLAQAQDTGKNLDLEFFSYIPTYPQIQSDIKFCEVKGKASDDLSVKLKDGTNCKITRFFYEVKPELNLGTIKSRRAANLLKKKQPILFADLDSANKACKFISPSSIGNDKAKEITNLLRAENKKDDSTTSCENKAGERSAMQVRTYLAVKEAMKNHYSKRTSGIDPNEALGHSTEMDDLNEATLAYDATEASVSLEELESLVMKEYTARHSEVERKSDSSSALTTAGRKLNNRKTGSPFNSQN